MSGGNVSEKEGRDSFLLDGGEERGTYLKVRPSLV